MSILRSYICGADKVGSVCSLPGFCDALSVAYTLKQAINLIASKTRVAPLVRQTYPRLELLSELLLENLVTTVFNQLITQVVHIRKCHYMLQRYSCIGSKRA